MIAKLGPFCNKDKCSLGKGGIGEIDDPFV